MSIDLLHCPTYLVLYLAMCVCVFVINRWEIFTAVSR